MSFPELSSTLAGPKAPDRCQSCGQGGRSEEISPILSPTLTRWREHDDQDKPTLVIVILCRDCSGRIIEPHPRLYSELECNRPWPGTVGLCVDCTHRVGVTCPIATFNGGPGIVLKLPKPTWAHLQRSPRRLSGWIAIYHGPVSHCSRRDSGEAVAS
jgi:hypothetical protein